MTPMLAERYDKTAHGDQNYVLMPKLNGVRAMYFPGVGFVSRDEKVWDAAKLSHIHVPKNYALDGELYVHGWSLQRINGAVSVNSAGITDDTRCVEYHAYDLPNWHGDALSRMKALDRLQFSQYFRKIQWYDGTGICHTRKKARYQAWVSTGYEGMMLKREEYVSGRTSNLLKWKAWQDDIFEFVDVVEGKGRKGGMAGAIVCRAKNGLTFEVGTGFSDALCCYWWLHRGTNRMPKRIKVKFINLSDSNIPLNSSFIEAYYE